MRQDVKSKKNCRTFFPMGFGVARVDGDVLVLNFIDNVDDENCEYEIVSSIAMTKEKAKSLVRSLNDAIYGEGNAPE